MSDSLKHECGIALLRLKKPLEFYQEKYGSALYGLNKMYLLMEKQHNRGQDGAGLANLKIDVPPGKRYISRARSSEKQPIADVFRKIMGRFEDLQEKRPDRLSDVKWLYENVAFTGEVFLGHLRYGTYGNNSMESVHPFLRQNNWRTRNLVLAGNFNLTNVDELFDVLIDLGQHPKEKADTVTILEKVGHFLDTQVEQDFQRFKAEGHDRAAITRMIGDELDLGQVLARASELWDGGYVIGGMVGHGDSFIMRDAAGIRPAFWYEDDEITVAASERPVIQTAFNVRADQVQELLPGQALIVRKNGSTCLEQVREAAPTPRKCSFERIYFSRGNDADIYAERKALGRLLVPRILEAVEHDVHHSVFSFIPNTAETSFYGMIQGLEDYVNESKVSRIIGLGDRPSEEDVRSILQERPRAEKVAIKDVKLRTFITQDSTRDDLVAHVYDVSYGTVRSGVDHLVVIDDSIVRGTTLKKSILSILDRLGPKSIVVASSAPQIRFPDCYGIDMARMGDFIAFQAAVSLIRKQGREALLDEVYSACQAELEKPLTQQRNAVLPIYEGLAQNDVSEEISLLLTPAHVNAKVKIIYQSIEGLHKAIPGHTGDWYFTGDYPTPGGNRVVNRAYIYWRDGSNKRAY
ncbi:MAG: amidophosphoribosyltransferase [Flavobacteriales bacterium]|nr:amidophosphoribosyltransferase [Flavobacteriales bacterium]